MSEALSFYTKRERQTLAPLITGTPVGELKYPIDKMKVAVARRFPEKDWDVHYFRALAFSNALLRLSEYNCTIIENEWVWYVPRTPTRVTLKGDKEPSIIYTVPHPKRLEPFLTLIWDKPRGDICRYVELLSEVGFAGVESVKIESIDVNDDYYKLSWRAGPHRNVNVMYLQRGKKK